MSTGRGISDQGNEPKVTEENSTFEDEFANALLDDGDGGGKAPESDKSGEEEEKETKDKDKDKDKDSSEEEPEKKEIDEGTPPEGEEDDPLKEIDDDATNEQRWKSLQGIYKRDKEKWNKEKEQLLTEIEKVKKAVTEKDSEKEQKDAEEEPKAPFTLKDFRESLTAEQKEELDQYEQDFDVVTRMEGLKRDMMLSQLKAELKSFMDEVKSQLEPTRKIVEELKKEGEVRSMEEHFGRIGEAHPDYEEYRDSGSLEVWVKSKPAYLQRGLMEVLNEGTAEEIIELLDDFKVENNIKKKIDPDKAAELDSRREKKRKAITTVNTKHGAVDVSAGSPDDFEGAFEEAMRQ